ncbi:MAG: hypothetical protein P1V81_05430 [Planctomycetota bacterium]|nr:hypothetical protein [Planctomycetota bacterium]
MMNTAQHALFALVSIGLVSSASAQDPVEGEAPPVREQVEQEEVQDPPPPTGGDTAGVQGQRPQLPAGLREKLQKPFADLKPGVLPEGTAPEAAKLFKQLIASSRVDAPDKLQGPVSAFDLAFELIVRGDGVERNQVETRVRYSADKGYVRFLVGEQLEMGFGEDGYWQIMEDGFRALTGRDYASDRKRILEVRAVCRNFLALAEPRNLRVTAVRSLAAAPTYLPAHAAAALEKRPLVWLEVESPDFDLALGATPDALDPTRLFRATLGIDATSGRIAEALVQEVRAGKPRLETSTWVTLGRYIPINGVLLPDELHVRYPVFQAGQLGFEDKSREDMYLLEGRLNPPLAPDAFSPKE